MLWFQVGFLAQLRRSEQSSLNLSVPARLERGQTFRIGASGIEAGPVFRPINKAGTVRTSRLTDRSVANIVKTYAGRAGFDPALFAGHSLRSGFLTSAAGKGASTSK